MFLKTPLLPPIAVDPALIDEHANFYGCVAVDLRSCDFANPKFSAMRSLLKYQSLPVLGLVDISIESEVWPELDLIATDVETVAALADACTKNPVAASILIQVTRIVERIPVLQGLTVESLAYSTLQSGIEFKQWLQRHRGEGPSPSAEGDCGSKLLLQRDRDTLLVTLNEADRRNPFSARMRDELADAFRLGVSDASIKAIRVRGAGENFCAGGDLSEFGTATDFARAHMIRQSQLPTRYLVAAPEKFEFFVHGACIGAGIEIPAFSHKLTATKSAYFRLPEVSMGLIPGAGGCVSLTHRIGRRRTNYLALTGQPLDAQAALEWGLVDEIS